MDRLATNAPGSGWGGGVPAAIHDHALIQLGDGPAACTLEDEWQHTVDQAGKAAKNHPCSEPARSLHVLAVGLAHGTGMRAEQGTNVHVHMLLRWQRYEVAKA